MKPKEVFYKKVFNLGDYQNEQIGITIELEEGDNVCNVIEQARNYVNLQSSPFKEKIETAESIIKDPDNYTGIAVKNAKKFIDSVEKTKMPKLSNISE